MIDFTSLPTSFELLRSRVPINFTLSERVIEPIIAIFRNDDCIVARLAGRRIQRGVEILKTAPTNDHLWLVDGDTFRPLPRDSVHLFQKALNGLNPNDVAYRDAIELLRNTDDILKVVPDETFIKSGSTAAQELEDTIVVQGLTANLFPYQARGVQWMFKTIRQTGGLILADEMGLGKTMQIIALLLMDPPKPEAPALIVCPTSLVANWVREFSRFANCLSVLVHQGPSRTGIYRGLMTKNIVITTYETLVNDTSIFSAFEWSWVVCDEAQAIKNPDSNRRSALCNVMRRRSIAMTGTPVENSLLDLWSLTDFVIPRLLGTRRDFEEQFPDDVDSAKALSKITDPIILKRRVADVAGDLPERLDIDIPLELGEELSEHYVAVRKETLANYPTAGALVATLQLQLVCAHPWLRIKNITPYTDGDDAELSRCDVYPLITPKMERTIELLREAFFNGDKVIVFALFNRVGDLIREVFQGFPTAFWGAINGGTPQEERQPMIDRFTEHHGPGCLILNPKAAGAGLNITAATVVIHFTPVWNPALEAQASARAHRRGQTRPVTVYRLFYKDTVEEVMIDRALWKSELANESVPVSSRDIDDLKRALEISPLRQ